MSDLINMDGATDLLKLLRGGKDPGLVEKVVYSVFFALSYRYNWDVTYRDGTLFITDPDSSEMERAAAALGVYAGVQVAIGGLGAGGGLALGFGMAQETLNVAMVGGAIMVVCWAFAMLFVDPPPIEVVDDE